MVRAAFKYVPQPTRDDLCLLFCLYPSSIVYAHKIFIKNEIKVDRYLLIDVWCIATADRD